MVSEFGDVFACRTTKAVGPGRHTLLGMVAGRSGGSIRPCLTTFNLEANVVEIVSTGRRSGQIRLSNDESFRTGRVWSGQWQDADRVWRPVQSKLWRSTRAWLWHVVPGGNLFGLFGRRLVAEGMSGTVLGACLVESRAETRLSLFWDCAERRDYGQVNPGFVTHKSTQDPYERWHALVPAPTNPPVRLMLSLN